MVDVSAKKPSTRVARAEARVKLSNAAARAIRSAGLKKGDALATAQIAGIMAAKQTPVLIPLTHPIPLSGVDVRFSWERNVLVVQTEARTNASTGVEMEALVAAAVAALTIYDMTKSSERGIRIEQLALLEKSGGRSGHWKASK
ncbi:MAG: cyclic pyranopterin monophosphate synthase MoaC [Candidatus Eremiobacteraeota bacterium]|nr:cyclic pyranopterin monophosphate synthase MoaC [Candidatus Eremiobacteraeota bacterium]